MNSSSDSPSDDKERRRRKSSTGSAFVHHTVTGLLMIGLLSLGVWGYLAARQGPLFERPDETTFERLADARRHADTKRVRSALEIYRIIHRQYPPALNVLVERGLLSAADLYYSSGRKQFRYRPRATGFDLDVRRRSQ